MSSSGLDPHIDAEACHREEGCSLEVVSCMKRQGRAGGWCGGKGGGVGFRVYMLQSAGGKGASMFKQRWFRV